MNAFALILYIRQLTFLQNVYQNCILTELHVLNYGSNLFGGAFGVSGTYDRGMFGAGGI